MKAFVITESALHSLAVAPLSPDWFISPIHLDGFPFRVCEDLDGIYIITPNYSLNEKLLVISRSTDGLFDAVPETERRGVFDRCMRLGLNGFDGNIAVNPRWMPFHGGNRLSIFAYGIGHKERLIAERNVKGDRHVFIFGFGSNPIYYELSKLTPDYDIYSRAVAGFAKLGGNDSNISVAFRPNEAMYDLPQLEQLSVTKGHTYSDWYPLRLTRDQLRFVDHKLTGPLRLRGAAGTGKTLAMAIKALKSKYDADLSGSPAKILFITHSWAMAEYVDRLIAAMDENPSGQSIIDVFPLLTLAEQKDYSEIGRQPLGIDSDEGKRLALREIGAVVEKFVTGDWVAYRAGCSIDFVGQVEAPVTSKGHRLFCWDVLVEFGCVIAAQGILTHASDKEKYLRVRRQRWMMPLDGTSEREVVFALWCMFMEVLRKKGLIQTDQIISDYLNELSTFYWEAARIKKGYDIIFVDETHLFNSQERLIFHNLLKDANTPPLVVMALDPQQSPRETFTNVQSEGSDINTNIFERARLPKPEKIDLTEVFRYTPEIAKVILLAREAAPGLDPLEDWDIPLGTSVASTGPTPRFLVVKDALASFKAAMSSGIELNKSARLRDGRVAILCMDGLRFEQFRTAAVGQYKNEIFVIASRDDIENLRYAGKKIIISTPEYVAGLQFDTVILVDANKDQVPEGKYHSFHLRRFLSELYLGLSRAQRDILIIASKEEGGLTPVLEKAIEGKVLVEISAV